MINSVGLQGPGVAAWLEHDLPAARSPPARGSSRRSGVAPSRSTRRPPRSLADAPAEVVAVEVNLSCPNTEAARDLFAHSADGTRAVMAATAACGRPRWAKLSPNVTDLVPIADAAARRRARRPSRSSTPCSGMAIDPETGAYRLGSGPRGGGLSGPAIHPIAVRAVHDVHAALPDLPIVGVGGVASGRRRRRAGPGRRLGGPGRHRHLRRPPGARPRPPGARGVGCRTAPTDPSVTTWAPPTEGRPTA